MPVFFFSQLCESAHLLTGQIYFSLIHASDNKLVAWKEATHPPQQQFCTSFSILLTEDHLCSSLQAPSGSLSGTVCGAGAALGFSRSRVEDFTLHFPQGKFANITTLQVPPLGFLPEKSRAHSINSFLQPFKIARGLVHCQ